MRLILPLCLTYMTSMILLTDLVLGLLYKINKYIGSRFRENGEKCENAYGSSDQNHMWTRLAWWRFVNNIYFITWTRFIKGKKVFRLL
ncbi:hypothetical protein HanIR_Chr02g0093471 [Helianthus annuus]|nr:hypothetical protein HanIR_Chr02g0093471 [Helianthus annuus]